MSVQFENGIMMSFCASIDFSERRTSKNNMAAFREVVMIKAKA